MTDGQDEPERLLLLGFVSLADHGFALPCYATGPGSNAWYTATCSVSGDHLAKITKFEVYAPDQVRRIPPELAREVKVGDDWCDVFLWSDQVAIGTPAELWQKFSLIENEIASDAPVSLLDLARFVPEADVAALSRRAFDYVKQHFGEERASHWRRDTLLRQHVVLHAQRAIASKKLRVNAADARDIEISETTEGSLELQINQKLEAALKKSGQLKKVIEAAKELADAFSLKIDDDEGGSTPDRHEIAEPIAEELAPPEREEDDDPARLSIVVVAIGPRAEQIARQINLPEWLPAWGVKPLRLPRLIVHVPERSSTEEIGPGIRRSRVGRPPLSGDSGVVIALADDEILMRGDLREALHLLDQLFFNFDAAIRVLVPALPTDRPARMLLANERWQKINGMDFDAILDTSTARAPFWVGASRRALDRRIADIIVGASTLVLPNSPLFSSLLKERRRRPEPPLITFALDWMRRNDFRKREDFPLMNMSNLGMISEASTGLRSGHKHRAWDFDVKWIDARRANLPTRGVVEFREGKPDFTEFGVFILDYLLEGYRVTSDRPNLPTQVMKHLKFPEQSAALQLPRKRNARVIVTAETPTIESVKAAWRLGWSIARYTDQETLREIVRPGQSTHSIMPGEIRLPNVKRLKQNRRIATRGIDPRDVFHLSGRDLKSYEGRPGQLSSVARRYMILRGEHFVRESIILPRQELLSNIEMDSSIRRSVNRVLAKQRFNTLPKRPSDLWAAWTHPRGFRRFAIADGVLPIRVVALRPGEVVAQNFFFIDGDASAIALFTSKLFEIWAEATMSRSMSWMSRFSVSKTFETFPIVPPFERFQAVEGPTAIGTRSKALLHRVEGYVSYVVRRDYRTRLEERHNRERTAKHEQIDHELMKVYDIPSQATDIEILERLSHLNHLSSSIPDNDSVHRRSRTHDD